MLKISGAYNQLTRILSWRGRRKSNEKLPWSGPEETADVAEQPQPHDPPKRKKSSLRSISKIIKRKTKDSVSKERLVTRGVDNVSSEEKMSADSQQTLQVAYQTRLNKSKDDADEGACGKSANDAQFEQLNLGAAFAVSQDELDDESLLNSSGNSFFLEVAFKQSINSSIEVLEEVHTVLTNLARLNRDSQERVTEKQLHWESTITKNDYKDPMWELAKQEWAKLQLYHYEQEGKVAEALNNLKHFLAANDDEDDNDMESHV